MHLASDAEIGDGMLIEAWQSRSENGRTDYDSGVIVAHA
jgi:hypothetical protein